MEPIFFLLFFTLYSFCYRVKHHFDFFLEIIFFFDKNKSSGAIIFFFYFLHLYKIKFLYLIRDTPRIFFFFFVLYMISFKTIHKSSLFLEPFLFLFGALFFFVFPFSFGEFLTLDLALSLRCLLRINYHKL